MHRSMEPFRSKEPFRSTELFMVPMLPVRDGWCARCRAAVRMCSGIRWHGRCPSVGETVADLLNEKAGLGLTGV
jgi:hypothetical protein